MSALDQRIDDSRRLIRRLESEGNAPAAELEAARLSGLVEARTLEGGADVGCLHPVHKTAGIDADSKQRWACARCGAIQ